MVHELAWINRESRAGFEVGLYSICTCGRHGALRLTKDEAVAEHAEHAAEVEAGHGG